MLEWQSLEQYIEDLHWFAAVYFCGEWQCISTPYFHPLHPLAGEMC